LGKKELQEGKCSTQLKTQYHNNAMPAGQSRYNQRRRELACLGVVQIRSCEEAKEGCGASSLTQRAFVGPDTTEDASKLEDGA